MGSIANDSNRQSEMASFFVAQVDGEEDNRGIKGYAAAAATAVTPEAKGVWGGEVRVESDFEFIETDGVEVGEVGGEVVEGIMEGVAGPIGVGSILAERVGEEGSCQRWVGDVFIVGADWVGCQGG